MQPFFDSEFEGPHVFPDSPKEVGMDAGASRKRQREDLEDLQPEPKHFAVENEIPDEFLFEHMEMLDFLGEDVKPLDNNTIAAVEDSSDGKQETLWSLSVDKRSS